MGSPWSMTMIKKLGLFILICFMASPVYSQWCDDANTTLCMPYDTDNATTAFDLSSSGNDGTAQNNATLISSGCHDDKCWEMDGTADSLLLDTMIALPTDGTWSICWWAYMDDAIGDDVFFGDPSTGDSYLDLWNNGGAGGQGQLETEDDVNNRVRFDILDSDVFLNDTWYHVCLVTTAGSAEFYLDGVLQDTGALVGSNDINITDIGEGHSSGLSLDGRIDESIILEGKALNVTEVNDIKDNGLTTGGGAAYTQFIPFN